MAATVITTVAVQSLTLELLEEIKKLLSQRQFVPGHKWLKSHEVRRMLATAQVTLEHLRLKGMLPFTMIGGVIITIMMTSKRSSKRIRTTVIF